jgi:hypothetical protein
MACRGWARLGKARRGRARRGSAWQGGAWPGMAGPGTARRGSLWLTYGGTMKFADFRMEWIKAKGGQDGR